MANTNEDLEPKKSNAKITFPNGKTFDIEVVTGVKGKLPYERDRQIAYENFIRESHALPDFRFWTAHVKAGLKSLERDLQLTKTLFLSKSKKADTVALRIERNTDLLFLDANHWYESLGNTGFSKLKRRAIKATTNEELKTLVRHLRNLREHQKDTHLYFLSSKPVPEHKDLKSVRWFQQQYPGADPWGIFYPGGDEEVRIAGVFCLSELILQLEQMELVIGA